MKQLLYSVDFFFIAFVSNAQQKDTISFFIDGLEKPPEQKLATYLRIGIRNKTIWEVYDLYLNEDKIRMKAYCTDDSLQLKEGLCEYYSKSGKVIAKGHYTRGKRVGLWKWMHENGQLQDSTLYKNDIPTGQSVGYYQDGNISYKQKFDSDGNGNGSEIRFYTSGIVRDSGSYTANKKNGIWFYYREDNSKASEILFVNDSAVSAKNFDTKGNLISSKLIEQEAAYPGGDEAWNKYLGIKLGLLYDKKDNRSYAGTCSIQFVVDTDGNLSNIEVIDTTNPKLSDFVSSFLKNAKKWNPAIQYNLYVKAYRRQRFTFNPE